MSPVPPCARTASPRRSARRPSRPPIPRRLPRDGSPPAPGPGARRDAPSSSFRRPRAPGRRAPASRAGGLLGAELGDALLAPLLARGEAALLFVGLGNDRGYRDRVSVLVHGDEGEVAGVGVAP